MKKRILTGDNTSGKLHIGHYVGSLENRVKLQHDYETFIILADMHALAYPKYISNPKIVGDATLDVAIANLAAGIDPEITTIYVESQIPEVFELSIILSMLTPYSRALRNPTIKDEIRDKQMGDSYSLGFVNFPTLMAADIMCVNANLVPVGEDQLPHLEYARELVNRFNTNYGETFNIPEGLVGRIARLIGLDGNAKMTKSLGNTIFLNEDRSTLKQKVMSMYTDPSRIHATDPGKVKGNPVFIYHDAFNINKEEVKDLKQRYLAGKVGDVEVKEKLFNALDIFLEPIRERYTYYDTNRDKVREILAAGTKKTRSIAQETLSVVLDKLKLQKF